MERKTSSGKKFIMDLTIAVVAGILGALAGSIYQARHTEDAIVEKMATELAMIDEKKSLAQSIDDIKLDMDRKDEQIKGYLSEIADLEERLSGGGDRINDLEKELSEEKAKAAEIESQLANYKFETPSLFINGETASADENSILCYKDQVFVGNSILRHFFPEGNIQYENGKLNMSTEGSVVVVNPILENSMDLTTMEATHKDDHVYTGALIDNEGNKHNSSIYAKYSDREKYIEYRLNKKYKYFECTAFVTNDALQFNESLKEWNTATITITTDNGVYLWGTDKISSHSKIQHSGLIDITGSTFIRVTFSGYPYYHIPIMAIGEPRLYIE